MEEGLDPGDCVRWHPTSPYKRGTAPNFRPVYCGQTTGWMKTPLGREVLNLDPGHHIVRLGPSSPYNVFNGTLNPTQSRSPAKGAQQPLLFSAHVYCGHGRPSQLLRSSFHYAGKFSEGGCAFLAGDGCLSNTMSPGPRPTSTPWHLNPSSHLATMDMG